MSINKLLMQISILILILLSAIVCNKSFAGHFPRGCEHKGFIYQGGNLILNQKGEQAFYLMKNRSTHPIELRRVETQEVFMSPSLTAKIASSNWAAFASDVENLYFQCFFTVNNQIELTDCKEVLDVCQYPRVKFALSNMGNYWVSINKNQTSIINDSTAKGIYLRW